MSGLGEFCRRSFVLTWKFVDFGRSGSRLMFGMTESKRAGLQCIDFKIRPVLHTMVAIWSSVQAAVCIMSCGAPVYKPVLPEPKIWGRLTPKASSGFLKREGFNQNNSNASSSTSSTKRREPSCERQEQGWLTQDDGSSLGLVWADRQGREGNASGGYAVVYPLEARTVQGDVR